MQNNDEKNPNLSNIQGNAQPTPLFTNDEIRSIVKGFILAWQRGQINLNLDDAHHIMLRAKEEGVNMSFKDAVAEEKSTYKEMTDLVFICSGLKQSSPNEIQKANEDLFELILRLRLCTRLDGKFFASDIEDRLDKMEEAIGRIDLAIKELYFGYRNLMSSSNSQGAQQ